MSNAIFLKKVHVILSISNVENFHKSPSKKITFNEVVSEEHGHQLENIIIKTTIIMTTVYCVIIKHSILFIR